MSVPPPLLRIDALRFRWPRADADSVRVQHFSMHGAERVFMRGPSGCGKSTLLALAAGVQVADTGTVALLGRDWRSLSASARDRRRAEHVGYVFQQFNLLPYLSVIDNVLLPCRLSASRRARARGDGAPLKAQAQRWLRALGLGAELDARAAADLSVGQQQRVAAARALIGQPELVIADEPTSALDEATRDAFMRALIDACVQAGSGLLFVSHDARLAVHFDRAVDLPALAAQEVRPQEVQP